MRLAVDWAAVGVGWRVMRARRMARRRMGVVFDLNIFCLFLLLSGLLFL